MEKTTIVKQVIPKQAPAKDEFLENLDLGLRLTVEGKVQAERLRYSKEVEKLILTDRKRLIELAMVDPLTKAYNRGYFEDAFSKIVARERRDEKVDKKNGPISLLMIDLDKFKLINDTFGHDMGDKVLQTVVKIIKNNLERETDVLARFGGEEFVIILENTPESGAAKVAEKIRKAIEVETKNVEGLAQVTASIGHATYDSRKINGVGLSTLMKSADDAAYQSKKMGRNRVTANSEIIEKIEMPKSDREITLNEIEKKLPPDTASRIEILEELLKKERR
jgi:diguanylate cyclase (GGDEF)-like protein